MESESPLISSAGNEEVDDLKHRVSDESKKIWKVALPGILARVASFGCVVVTQSFIGHLGKLELAGYALVQSLSVRFVNGILECRATETLCGQAFGAGQLHMMGIYLQRSWIVDLITVTVLLPVFILENIAQSAGHISLWFIPAIYSFVFSFTAQMFLQAQQKNMVIAWLSIAQFVIHVPMCWVFVNHFNWGIAGAMGSLNLSFWFVVFGEFIYIFGGWCPLSWRGFTTAAFKDLWPVIKLSVSSGVMICLELWYTAVLVVLAGYMKNAEVAISAFSICLNINYWELNISLGLYGAACVRVANELGRGDAKAVKFAIKVILGISTPIGVFFWIICLIFGNEIGYLFSKEKEVADTISDLSFFLSFSVLLNTFYPLLSGVAVGAGLQSSVAIISLICYYLIGIPIGALLGYLGHMQVKGIWIGMICGIVAQTLALSFMIWRTNWDIEVAKTRERLNRWYLKSSEEPYQTYDCD